MSENEEIRKLLEGVVPERLDEVLGLVRDHSAQFRRLEDKRGFTLDAGAYGAIQFTQRSLQQIWLFGFSGMYALHAYSGIVVLAKSQNLPFDLDEIDTLQGQVEESQRFSNLIRHIEQLKDANSELDIPWPKEIPDPEDGRPAHIEGAAVFDLILMATTYVFLHELKHVMFESEGNAPSDPVEEEMQCDAFAADIMLVDIAKYSASSGYPAEKVRMKRSMGIALGSAFLAIATPKDRLKGTASHPPVHQRWSATLGVSTLPENDYYWLYFASLAIAILRYKKITFPATQIVSFKQLALSAIEALEIGI